MSFISKLFQGFLNLFRSAAEAAWASMSKDLQNNALTAAQAVQIIKTSIDKGYTEIKLLVAAKTGFTVDQVDQFILAIAKDAGVSTAYPEKSYALLQEKAKAVDTDNEWNALWQNLMKFGATYLTSGKLDWITLSLGVAQLAYEKITKK